MRRAAAPVGLHREPRPGHPLRPGRALGLRRRGRRRRGGGHRALAGHRSAASPLADRVRLTLVSATGRAGAKRNRAVAASTAPHVLFLDDDDELAPGWWTVVCELALDPGAALACGTALIVDDHGTPTGVQPIARLSRLHEAPEGRFLAGTYVVSRELFDAAGGFDERFPNSENWELSIRLVAELRAAANNWSRPTRRSSTSTARGRPWSTRLPRSPS